MLYSDEISRIPRGGHSVFVGWVTIFCGGIFFDWCQHCVSPLHSGEIIATSVWVLLFECQRFRGRFAGWAWVMVHRKPQGVASRWSCQCHCKPTCQPLPVTPQVLLHLLAVLCFPPQVNTFWIFKLKFGFCSTQFCFYFLQSRFRSDLYFFREKKHLLMFLKHTGGSGFQKTSWVRIRLTTTSPQSSLMHLNLAQTIFVVTRRNRSSKSDYSNRFKRTSINFGKTSTGMWSFRVSPQKTLSQSWIPGAF